MQKKVVFRVIGNYQVGMGHIFRTISLAEELKDHKLSFLTDIRSDLAITHLSSTQNWCGAFTESEMTEQILSLEPDLVVFDVLDTKQEDIIPLREEGIAVVSFEDLGAGSAHTTLTINELFDAPELEGENYRWGKQFFFVRDEFLNVSPREKPEKIDNLLLTFGGVDQHNLSQKILLQISDLCREAGIQIHIVTGPGYRDEQALRRIVDASEGVDMTHATGVISRIMAEADLAISSNGRTVYELTHMNVPGIVIDQHVREGTHHFARRENGFINLGLYNPGVTELAVLRTLSNLIKDRASLGELYEQTSHHQFTKAESRGVIEIKRLLV